MSKETQWYLIENEKDYQKAITRFEEIYETTKGRPFYKEKLLLAFLINQYEQKL